MARVAKVDDDLDERTSSTIPCTKPASFLSFRAVCKWRPMPDALTASSTVSNHSASWKGALIEYDVSPVYDFTRAKVVKFDGIVIVE